MKIPVVGFDPSMTHWGIASAELDLTTGYLSTPVLSVLEPEKPTGKQVRQNSMDLAVARQLAEGALPIAKEAKAVFVECPHGSQSARAMASYGICVGILGSLLATGVQLIEVSEKEVKLALSGDRYATKNEMITIAIKLYPEANFPRYTQNGKGFRKGEIMASRAEHAADAIGAIHAGVNTPLFQNLMKLLSH